MSVKIACAEELLRAIESGNPQEVERLLKNGTDPHFDTFDGKTGLQIAIEKGYITIVRALLEAGHRTSKGTVEDSPLMVAILQRSVAAVKLLLEYGADPYECGLSRCARNHLAIAKLLLCHGMNPDLPDKKGYTPLYSAVVMKNVALAKLLLKHGADPDKNPILYDGMVCASPMSLASEIGCSAMVELLSKFRS